LIKPEVGRTEKEVGACGGRGPWLGGARYSCDNPALHTCEIIQKWWRVQRVYGRVSKEGSEVGREGVAFKG